MKRGDKVVVVKSWSSDITSGIEGVMERRMRGGYAVKIRGLFTDARGHRCIETRTLFFSTNEIRKTETISAGSKVSVA